MATVAAKSFLDLPSTVRQKIYSFCGLIRECLIDLTPQAKCASPPGAKPENGAQSYDWQISNDNDDEQQHTCFYLERKQGAFALFRKSPGHDCSCECLPRALLLVSKAIHKEVSAILYGQNTFVLRAHTGDDLIPLIGMRVEDLASIDSLLIRLNCWPCPWGHEGNRPDDTVCAVCSTPDTQADPVLDLETQEGQDLIRKWTAVCRRLSDAILPAKLKLTFICDAMDLESAHQVIKPLRTLPALKSCTIRLGRSQNNELRSLAQKSSLEMTRTIMPPFSFLFETLPKELRLQILSYTHLSTPGTCDEKFNKLVIERSKLVRFYNPHFVPASCCFKCTDTFADCCCPSSHASYSDSCVCRVLPLELFLVSRQTCQDAFEAFYESASFVFSQDPVDTITFLSNLSTGALGFIRKLEFKVGYEHIQNWKESSYREQYRNMFAWIKANLNLPLLSLLFDSEELYDELLFAEEEADTRFYYDAMDELVEELKTLCEIAEVDFKLAWFLKMGPIWKKRIRAEKYVEETEDWGRIMGRVYAIPSWYKLEMENE